MKAIIDRFEGEIAVLEFENGTMQDVTKSKLPPIAKEGDCLIIDDDNISIDENETNLRRKNIRKLMDELFED